MLLVSHPFGNPNSYEVALAAQQADLLVTFETCLYDLFGKRRHPELNVGLIQCRSSRELLRLCATKCPGLTATGRSKSAVDWVGRQHDRSVANALKSRKTKAVWVYEDFAHDTAKQARDMGMTVFYDLPTVHYREAAAIARSETSQDPTLVPFWASSNEPLARLTRKQGELDLADRIVVASSFVKRTLVLQGVDAARIVVLPYGAPATVVKPPTRVSKKSIRCFYAGNISPHKGIHHLFRALARLNDRSVELTLAGTWAQGFERWLRNRFPAVRFRWLGPLSHSELMEQYVQHDFFVFPAVQDGFGLVLLEALSRGVPIVASRNSGAPDIISEGRGGFLFDAQSESGLSSALETAFAAYGRLPELREEALRTAREYSWGRYRAGIRACIENHYSVTHSPPAVAL